MLIRFRCICLVLFALQTLTPSTIANELRSIRRTITTLEFLEFAPLFTTSIRTLDPIDIVRKGRMGYLAKCWEPWGMTDGLKPTYRFFFLNEALPWPILKHHGVDGFDNNSRNMGAHALLHDMLGEEKQNDSVETGQLAYLLSITDPESGLPYNAERLPRHCALGHGELAKNIMLLYEQTKEQRPWLKEWAAKMLMTLRRYAHVSELEGVGPIAEYYQGGIGGQGGFDVGSEPVSKRPADLALDGWQHLYLGWNCHAFSKWYELTGDPKALDFAVALANRLMNSSDEFGDDGAFRPDGSFGSVKGIVGSIHGHSHAHCLVGLTHLGTQLFRADRPVEAKRFVAQAEKSFRFLFDRTRNPDAGSYVGWVPEFLAVLGGMDRPGDCEGCTTGDVVQVAVMLGAASRQSPQVAHLEEFYDWAERFYRGQLVGSLFSVTPRYLELVRANLETAIQKELHAATAEEKKQELLSRMAQAQEDAKKLEGRCVGLCGFPDQVNSIRLSEDKSLRSLHMMGCCADASIRGSHAIWSQTVTGTKDETRINLAFNRDHRLARVISSLPHRGELNIVVGEAKRILVRVPEWAPRDRVKMYIGKKLTEVTFTGRYATFDRTQQGQQLTVTYPLQIAEVQEVVRTDDFVRYRQRWRGNTIVDIKPVATLLPMFQRPELDSEQLPE